MAEKELDLVELAAGPDGKDLHMFVADRGAPVIYSGRLSRSLDDLSNHLRSHALAPDLSDLLIALKRQLSLIPLASLQRLSASLTHSGIGTLRVCRASRKVGNHPALLSKLNRRDQKGGSSLRPNPQPIRRARMA